MSIESSRKYDKSNNFLLTILMDLYYIPLNIGKMLEIQIEDDVSHLERKRLWIEMGTLN